MIILLTNYYICFWKKFEHYYIGAIKQHTMPKSKTENKTVEIKTDMDSKTYSFIFGIKLKCLSAKKNGYGEYSLFQVLDEKHSQDIFTLAQESLKMQAWKYNAICYLKNHQRKVDQYAINQSNKTQDGEIDIV